MCLSNLGLAGDHKIYEPDKAPFSILVVDRINLFGVLVSGPTLTVCIEFEAKTRVFCQVLFHKPSCGSLLAQKMYRIRDRIKLIPSLFNTDSFIICSLKNSTHQKCNFQKAYTDEKD